MLAVSPAWPNELWPVSSISFIAAQIALALAPGSRWLASLPALSWMRYAAAGNGSSSHAPTRTSADWVLPPSRWTFWWLVGASSITLRTSNSGSAAWSSAMNRTVVPPRLWPTSATRDGSTNDAIEWLSQNQSTYAHAASDAAWYAAAVVAPGSASIAMPM